MAKWSSLLLHVRLIQQLNSYSCNDGYRLDNGDAKRTRQAEGTWSGEAPRCFPLDNKSTIAAIVGGVACGLVVLGVMSLLSGIIIVAVKLNKQGSQINIEAVYDEPDYIQQYKSKKDEDLELEEYPAYGQAKEDIELEECPAYVEKREDDIKLEECPAYGQAKEDIELEECPAYYVEKRKEDIQVEECPE